MASTSQALTGHISVLESKKSPLYNLAFSLALKIYVLRMEGVAGIWVTVQYATTHMRCWSLRELNIKFPSDRKEHTNQQRNFEELYCPMTRPPFFSFELPASMEPHWVHSLHSCTIVALCLLQQCVVTPPRLDGKVLPSFVFLLQLMLLVEFFTQSWNFNLENGLKRLLCISLWFCRLFSLETLQSFSFSLPATGPPHQSASF